MMSQTMERNLWRQKLNHDIKKSVMTYVIAEKVRHHRSTTVKHIVIGYESGGFNNCDVFEGWTALKWVLNYSDVGVELLCCGCLTIMVWVWLNSVLHQTRCQRRWLSRLKRSLVHSLMIARRSLCPEKLGSNPNRVLKRVLFSDRFQFAF